MKKGMILKRQDGLDFELKDMISFQDYAKKNDLNISGIIAYPIEMTLIDPQRFAEVLKKMNQDIFLVNDSDIFISDVVRDGEVFKILDDNDITIMHVDLDIELKNMYSQFPGEIIENMKNDLRKNDLQESYRVAVIDSHDIDINQDDDLDRFLKGHRIDKVLALQMNVFHESMKPILNKAMKDNDINLVIILDEKLINQAFQEYIKELKAESIDIKYSDDLQNEMENSYSMQEMFVS